MVTGKDNERPQRIPSDEQARLEERARELAARDIESKSIEELQVYAIELQLQHEELVATRQAREASLTDFAQLFQTAPVGYLILDPDGSVVRVNERARAMFGVEETAGWTLSRLLAPVGKLSFEAFLNRVRQSDPIQTETVRFH